MDDRGAGRGADALAQYLRAEKAIQSEADAVKAALESVREGSQDRLDLVGRILTHCSRRITYGDGSGTQDALAVLTRGTANSIGGARAMVALCRAANIPARLVTGFEMGEEPFAEPHTLMEAYLGDTWVAYDPETGAGSELPSTFVPVRIGGSRIVRPAADDKMITKRIAEERGIPIPRTYAVIERYGDIARLSALAADHQEFVIKPTKGAAGRGSVVVSRHADGIFESPSGNKTSLADLRAHISTNLSGLYSLAVSRIG